jgi:surface antigen
MRKLFLCSVFSVLSLCILSSCTPKPNAATHQSLMQATIIDGRAVSNDAFSAKDRNKFAQSDQYRKMVSSDLIGGELGGLIGKQMKPVDRDIMRSAVVRAEDKHWQNNSTGMSFTLIPSKYKKHYKSGSICRLFSIAAVDNQGSNEKMHSRACLNSDGQWRIVRTR